MKRLTPEDMDKLEAEGFEFVRGTWGPNPFEDGDDPKPVTDTKTYGCAVTALVLLETGDQERTSAIVADGIRAFRDTDTKMTDYKESKTAQWSAIADAIGASLAYVAGLEIGFERAFFNAELPTDNPDYQLGFADGEAARRRTK